MTDHQFALWLDITMNNKGIKGRTLAKKIGVHDSAISRWRNGQATPSLDTTMRLATVLGVDPIRLAVTAGLMDAETVHVEPLGVPSDEARRAHVREQIKAIKGLSTESIERLLRVTDEELKEGDCA